MMVSTARTLDLQGAEVAFAITVIVGVEAFEGCHRIENGLLLFAAKRACVAPTNTTCCGVPIERSGHGGVTGFTRRLNASCARRLKSQLAVNQISSSC